MSQRPLLFIMLVGNAAEAVEKKDDSGLCVLSRGMKICFLLFSLLPLFFS